MKRLGYGYAVPLAAPHLQVSRKLSKRGSIRELDIRNRCSADLGVLVLVLLSGFKLPTILLNVTIIVTIKTFGPTVSVPLWQSSSSC